MNQSKKVLIVCSNGPESSFGGGQRNILIGRLFESIGYAVEMILVLSREWGTYNENSNLFNDWKKKFTIKKIFQPSFRHPFFPSLELLAYIHKNQDDYSWIIFRYEIIAFKSGFYFLKKSKIIIDFDDFILPTVTNTKFAFHFIRHIFQYLRVSKCFYLNESLQKYFREKGLWVPNIPLSEYWPSTDSPMFSKNLSSSPLILHIVSDYDALIHFFNSDQFSSLLKKLPNLKFIFICRKIDKMFSSQLRLFNIEWVENPDKIDIYYIQAWASLILEKKKHGTHIKFIESIHFYTPVIGFYEAFRGYEMFLEHIVNIPASYDDLCNQIYLLGSNVEYISKLAEKNKIIQNEYFSLKKLTHSLKILYE